MSQIVSVGRWMPPVKHQQFGSCVGHTVCTAAECLHAVTYGTFGMEIDPYWVYWYLRVKQNFFGEGWGADTGGYAADGFDVAMNGVPRDSLWNTPTHAGEEPPESLNADAPNQDYVLGHHPFYASDPGGFMAGIWTALGNKQPVAIAMAWYNRWFDHEPILPDTTGPLVGYHELCVYAGIPAGVLHPERLAIARNSWGAYTDVTELRRVLPEAMPGDIAIPERYFLNGTVNECRAATAEAIVVPPSEHCDQEVHSAQQVDADKVLRVRSRYKPNWPGSKALLEAENAIRNQ